mmetsp:Transcript_68822/g.194982  ORF Transcript_68822/g.194982 Transcript_68822/m.194982 type:complete len:267 (+) Transcript_68822:900-1700(+)
MSNALPGSRLPCSVLISMYNCSRTQYVRRYSHRGARHALRLPGSCLKLQPFAALDCSTPPLHSLAANSRMKLWKLGTTPFAGRPVFLFRVDRHSQQTVPGPVMCNATPSIARYSTLSPTALRPAADQPSSATTKPSASRTSSTTDPNVCRAADRSRVRQICRDICGASRKLEHGESHWKEHGTCALLVPGSLTSSLVSALATSSKTSSACWCDGSGRRHRRRPGQQNSRRGGSPAASPSTACLARSAIRARARRSRGQCCHLFASV